ncbi:hypothetical protein [Bradyrhizobium sp. 23AC]
MSVLELWRKPRKNVLVLISALNGTPWTRSRVMDEASLSPLGDSPAVEAVTARPLLERAFIAGLRAQAVRLQSAIMN